MSRSEEVWVPVTRLIQAPCLTPAVTVNVFNSWDGRCPTELIRTLSITRARILFLLRLLADYVPGLGFVTRKWDPLLCPCSYEEKSWELSRIFVEELLT